MEVHVTVNVRERTEVFVTVGAAVHRAPVREDHGLTGVLTLHGLPHHIQAAGIGRHGELGQGLLTQS